MSAQLILFLQSILLGAALGLLYDFLRALRRRGGGPLWQGILDGLYAAASAAALFFFVMTGDGELRLFILMGALGGAVLHFCLFSRPMAPLLDFWLGIFLVPWNILEKFAKKVGSICKKLFSFWKRWFTITVKRAKRPKTSAEKGGSGMTKRSRNTRAAAAVAKEKAPRRRCSKLTMLLLLALALGIMLQLRSMKSALEAAREEEAVYTQRLEDLRETNARLSMEIANSSDQELLESIARDELGMAAPGEKIFRFN